MIYLTEKKKFLRNDLGTSALKSAFVDLMMKNQMQKREWLYL
jgi:hypothetical protein